MTNKHELIPRDWQVSDYCSNLGWYLVTIPAGTKGPTSFGWQKPEQASHNWRLERSGEFPKRIRLGGNRVAWLQSEVESWIKGKIVARDDGTPPVKLGGATLRHLPEIETLEQKE